MDTTTEVSQDQRVVAAFVPYVASMSVVLVSFEASPQTRREWWVALGLLGLLAATLVVEHLWVDRRASPSWTDARYEVVLMGAALVLVVGGLVTDLVAGDVGPGTAVPVAVLALAGLHVRAWRGRFT